MEISKRIPIEYKVFTRRDIDKIAKLFSNEKQNSSDHYRLKFVLIEFDNSRYSYDDLIFIQPDSKLDTANIEQLKFSYSDFKDRSMFLELKHGSSKFLPNEFQVEGTDEDWINAKRKAFEDILKDSKDQKKENELYKFVLSPLTVISLLITFLLAFRMFNLYVFNFEGSSFVASLIFSTFLFISLMTSSFIWREYLNTFPVIEFDFGPEHYRLEKIKRNRFRWILGTYAFPILLAIISYLV